MTPILRAERLQPSELQALFGEEKDYSCSLNDIVQHTEVYFWQIQCKRRVHLVMHFQVYCENCVQYESNTLMECYTFFLTYVLLSSGQSGVWAAVWQWEYSGVWLEFSLWSWLWEAVCSPSTPETCVLQPGILYQTRGAEERTPEKHGRAGKTLSEPDQTWSERKTAHYLLETKWRR